MRGHRPEHTGRGHVHFRLNHTTGEKLLEPGEQFDRLLRIVPLHVADAIFSLIDGDPRDGERSARQFRQPFPNPVRRLGKIGHADYVGINENLPHRLAASNCWSRLNEGMLTALRLLKCYRSNLCWRWNGMNPVWTAKDLERNLARVLEQARTVGPQRICDETGIYVLKIEDDFSKPDAADSLLKLRPKG